MAAVKPKPAKGSRLKVLWQVPGDRDKNGWRRETWICQCKCGQTAKVLRVRIESGATKSCGCLRREKARARMPKAKAVMLENARQRRLSNG